MPKKRHQTLYSKPQLTPAASLGTSASGSSSAEKQQRGVNELLADLRRTNLSSSGTSYTPVSPSVPPTIQQILQLPETPPPAPRRPRRRDASGRRLPPGPPAPRSWLSRSKHADRVQGSAVRGLVESHGLPGMYEPALGSMMDIILRHMAVEWEFQRAYNRYYLYSLPSRVRASLIRYIGHEHEGGISVIDLRTIFIPPAEEDGGSELDAETLADINNDFHYLDLSGSVGRTISVKELADFLFPSQLTHSTSDVLDSWDTAEIISVPAQLIPNISHLSLGTTPQHASRASWKHLLSLASKLPTLTHLSLAFWPEPSLTPNAKFSSVISPQGRAIQYGGTGPYSHSLDDDWSEAIILLRKLSKSLYRLEYLDLTGCGAWFKVLMATVDRDCIDWKGHWGKISTLKLRYGYELGGEASISSHERLVETAETAKSVERHIVARRAGKGRFITIDRDEPPMA